MEATNNSQIGQPAACRRASKTDSCNKNLRTCHARRARPDGRPRGHPKAQCILLGRTRQVARGGRTVPAPALAVGFAHNLWIRLLASQLAIGNSIDLKGLFHPVQKRGSGTGTRPAARRAHHQATQRQPAPMRAGSRQPLPPVDSQESSAQILWTKVCAMASLTMQVLDLKDLSYQAQKCCRF